MKRTVVLVVTLALLSFGLVLPTAQAAPSAEGALQSAFQSAFSGGNGVFYASIVHDSEALWHAANAYIFDPDLAAEAGAQRIVPGFFDQEYCDTNVFGIWWYLLLDDKDAFDDVEVRIWFDGEELTLEQTAVKRVVDPQDTFYPGVDLWWRSVGVPVYGMLEPGEYLVESTITAPDSEDFEEQALITILDC